MGLCYIATSSLIGWAHTQDDPCTWWVDSWYTVSCIYFRICLWVKETGRVKAHVNKTILYEYWGNTRLGHRKLVFVQRIVFGHTRKVGYGNKRTEVWVTMVQVIYSVYSSHCFFVNVKTTPMCIYVMITYHVTYKFDQIHWSSAITRFNIVYIP